MANRVEILCGGTVDGGAKFYMVTYDADGRLLSAGYSDAPGCVTLIVARYTAVVVALTNALELFSLAATPVTIKVKSRQIVNQMKGKWPVKKKALLPLHRKAVALAEKFADIIFQHTDKDIPAAVLAALEAEKEAIEEMMNG